MGHLLVPKFSQCFTNLLLGPKMAPWLAMASIDVKHGMTWPVDIPGITTLLLYTWSAYQLYS
jgi:hypothetical protein